MAENQEIERKFLVQGDEFFEYLTDGIVEGKKFENSKITQAYLQVGDVEKRVRQDGDKYIGTVKVSKDGDGMVCGETNTEITKEEFEAGKENCIGNVIEKTRYRIPLDSTQGLTAEVDIYAGALGGLVVAEVEFKDKEAANAFDPFAINWLGADVTSRKEYKNQNLALNGKPRPFDLLAEAEAELAAEAKEHIS